MRRPYLRSPSQGSRMEALRTHNPGVHAPTHRHKH
jgi:hypothetical protein